MEERIVILYDEYNEMYCKTNASNEEITAAINAKCDSLNKNDSLFILDGKEYGSDFEFVQAYLAKTNKFIEELGSQDEPERFYW